MFYGQSKRIERNCDLYKVKKLYSDEDDDDDDSNDDDDDDDDNDDDDDDDDSSRAWNAFCISLNASDDSKRKN